jgi:hypothetical protein
MPNLTRRGLLVLGGTGAAGVALSACGKEVDPRAQGRDGELLATAADAEAALGSVYDGLATSSASDPAIAAFRDASSGRQDELQRLGAKTSGAPSDTEGNTVASADTAAAIAAASTAIAAYREAAGLLSTTELRAPAIEFLTQVAAEQATLRGLAGDDQSPVAFVTGGKQKPYVASDVDGSTTTTSSTSTSSTTSTSTTTSEGG